MKDDNRQVISSGNFVLIEEDKMPRFCWRKGFIERLIYEKDVAARRAVVRISKHVGKYQETSCTILKLLKIGRKK